MGCALYLGDLGTVSYTSGYRRTINAVAPSERPVLLLRINSPDLAEPIRVVQDSQDLVSNGETFIAMPFIAFRPSQPESGQPVAKLAMDNVGRELVSWIDSANGGEGATVDILEVRRSDPDTVEYSVSLDLSNVSMNTFQVTGQLSFDDLLNRPAVLWKFTPDRAPGLY